MQDQDAQYINNSTDFFYWGLFYNTVSILQPKEILASSVRSFMVLLTQSIQCSLGFPFLLLTLTFHSSIIFGIMSIQIPFKCPNLNFSISFLGIQEILFPATALFLEVFSFFLRLFIHSLIGYIRQVFGFIILFCSILAKCHTISNL